MIFAINLSILSDFIFIGDKIEVIHSEVRKIRKQMYICLQSLNDRHPFGFFAVNRFELRVVNFIRQTFKD